MLLRTETPQFRKIDQAKTACLEAGIPIISHDTSEFVCKNIERVWREHLGELYPDAKMLVILCDGGGSNSCRHHIVK